MKEFLLKSADVFIAWFFISIALLTTRLLQQSLDYWFYPDLLIILIVYWTSFQSFRYGVFSVWISGLFMDAWEQQALGQNSLLFVVISFIWYLLVTKNKYLPLNKQIIILLLISLAYRFITLFIQQVLPELTINEFLWLALGCVLNGIVWAALVILLKKTY